MVRGYAGLQCGKDKDFARGADLENCAAAVAHVEVSGLVESDAGGHAHAFDPLFSTAVRGDTVDGAVVAARNEEIAAGADGQAAWVDQRGNERLDAVVGGDSVE